MRLRINSLISVLALATIVWSVRFAVAQEHRRTPQYLQAMYQQLNEKVFENALPTARLEWGDLTDAMGQTSQEGDDSFVIQVDRESNFSFWVDDELRDTVEHETCHVATWSAEEDAHGPSWQACMTRIHAK